MIVTNRKNTKFGKYDGFSTNLLIGEINSGSKEICNRSRVIKGLSEGVNSPTYFFHYYMVAFQNQMVYSVIHGINHNIPETIGLHARYSDHQEDRCVTSQQKQAFYFSRSLQDLELEAAKRCS